MNIITLKNLDKTDVRRYKLLVNPLPKPVKAALEFKVPAREVITQELPIINSSQQDWHIKALITAPGDPKTNNGK